MKKILINLTMLFFCLAIFTSFSFGCSLAPKILSEFPSDWYIFTGKVIDYTDKLSAKGFLNDANGLKIKIKENVNLPKKTKNNFVEVFSFGLAPDCTDLGYYRDELEKYYPIGSRVIVIARKAEWLPTKNKLGQLRLEAPKQFGVFRDNDSTATVKSVYDYEKCNRCGYPFISFELLKDLKRIKESKTESEKIEIYQRLVYFPNDDYSKFYFDFKESIEKQDIAEDIKTKLIAKDRTF